MKIAMTHLHKLKKLPILRWLSLDFADSQRKNSLWPAGSFYYLAKNPRFYSRDRLVYGIEKLNTSIDKGQKSTRKISRRVAIKEAQSALLEYLHVTRSIPFTDAENMSVNAPCFLNKLLQKVGSGEPDIGMSLTRFLRYHPINEFEPFFESLGLKPREFGSLLPRDMMFLSDDYLLLENYFVLCNYGIPRNKIGRIYVEVTDIFSYDYGVLTSKLQAYEKLGLSQSFVCKVVTCSPYLLVGHVNVDFVKVQEILRGSEFEFGWIEEHLSGNCCNWSQMLLLLKIFRKEGSSDVQLGALIRQHPSILFEGSGDKTLSLVGFLLKFGLSMNEICSIFTQFPHMQVGKFVHNLKRSFLVLTGLEMEPNEIGNVVRCHPLLLGSFTLKSASSLNSQLSAGKKFIRKVIQDNPQEMMKWKLGSRVERLPKAWEESKRLKIKFLTDMGMADNPQKMECALKVLQCSGFKIQERFDCIMNAGLDRKDVCEMIQVLPQILNLEKEILEKKIDVLVNDLGQPISYLRMFPSYLKMSIERIKLRHAMYIWLKDQGSISSSRALSTALACAESLFVTWFVKQHPRGLEVWEELKNKFSSN